jgi:hypothetical protein
MITPTFINVGGDVIYLVPDGCEKVNVQKYCNHKIRLSSDCKEDRLLPCGSDLCGLQIVKPAMLQ